VRQIAAILSILFCLAACTARAAHTQVKLILSAVEVKPGDTIWAGVDLKMEPGWHTYWKNPGAAGMATEIKWQLPPGISAGEIQWPLPEKLPPMEVTTYGYENEVMLLVPLKIETNFPSGQIDLKANVSWLECKEVCIPQNQDVHAALKVGGITQSSENEMFIQNWLAKIVPQPNSVTGKNFSPCSFLWGKLVSDDTRQLLITADVLRYSDGEKKGSETPVDFYPYASDQFEVQSETDIVSTNSNRFQFLKLVKKFSGDWPKEISGVLVVSNNNSLEGFEVKLPIADQVPAGETISSTTNQSPAPPSQSLWKMLLFAFIGGLILNIMPCVLPVIALKILGFVGEARSEPRRVRNLGLIYALGVLISFFALAAIVIGVKAAGHRAGWGMQFGNPIFIVCLTTLVTLVALNLFGVFEVVLGGKVFNAAGQLASKHGAPGAFFNGVLATILATPCTAPFLSIALGFAFAQKSPTIILIFLFVGIGLAAPYVLLSCNPALLKFLPKPGAWMEKFKIAMGFPMLATVVWLFNVAASSYGKNVLWLGIFLVVVAFAAWIFGEFFQRGRKHKIAAVVIVLILLAGGYFFALEKELDWRVAMPADAGSLKESARGIDWQRWSPEAVAHARAEGRPVIVDFTADWCLTCQVNKKTSIEISSVEKKMKDVNAVALIADYTRTPADIFDELQRFGRPSVPLVLVYPKNPGAQPIVLPEVLTPGIVLNALDRAAR
jgi:thiol:disulfide interchange protein DsbD